MSRNVLFICVRNRVRSVFADLITAEENPSYVTKVIGEVEELMNRGFPRMLKKLGIE